MSSSKFYQTLFSTIIFIGALACSHTAWGQGGWDMKYIPIGSITKAQVGKPIRIDFKSSASDNVSGKVNVRKLLSKKDTVALDLDNDSMQFVESWKIFVDRGYLKDQSLESLQKNNQKQIIIKEMWLDSFDNYSLNITATFYNRSNSSKSFEKAGIKKIRIPKNIIKGLVVAISE